MGKKGGDDAAAQAAAQARADEQARQARIRTGTARINALFDGKPIPADGSNPLGTFKGVPVLGDILGKIPGLNGGGADPLAGNTFKGFTDDFFKGIRDSYSNYATPQLESQLADARKQLIFALDRSKLLDSSTRASKQAELEKQAGVARQGIADTAVSTENQARNNIEAARADLISQLNTTGDDQLAVTSALNRVQTLSQPQQFSPLSGLFANFTAGLGAQAAAERAQYYSNGAVKAPFNTGLFAPSSGSVRVS